MKSEKGSLPEADCFELPDGETVEVPIDVSIEMLIEGCAGLREHWMENYFDEQAAIEAKNSERFEM